MRSQRVFWTRLAVATVLFLLAFGLLAVGANKAQLLYALGAGILLALAVVMWERVLRQARQQRLPVRYRLLLPILLFAGGLVTGMLALYLVYQGLGGGWIALAAVCATYVGIGLLMGEWRAARHDPLPVGLAWLATCALAFLLGLAGCLLWGPLWLIGVGLGLLLAPVGLTLATEGVLRRHWKSPSLAVRLGSVVAGAVLLGLLLHSTSVAVVLAIAAPLLVGAIASDTLIDVLVVVTFVALVWTAGASPERRPAPPTQASIVVLGDSYISGEGTSEFFEGTNTVGRNQCRRSPRAYPQLVADERDERLRFLACSGAKTVHVVDESKYRGEPLDDTPRQGLSQLAQLEASAAQPPLVILSMGGNDAGFSNIATACLAPGSCVERGQVWYDRLQEVAGAIDGAYERLDTALKHQVPVLVVPYPLPIADRTCDVSSLSGDEHRYLRRFVNELNRVVHRAAEAHGFHYLETMQTVFTRTGLQICDDDDGGAGVNFLQLKTLDGLAEELFMPYSWLHNSFHPNDDGHKEMAKELRGWIDGHRDAQPLERKAVDPVPRARLSDPPKDACGQRGEKEPRFCDDEDDTAWTVAKVAGLVGAVTPALLLLTGGAWLLWLPRLRPAGPPKPPNQIPATAGSRPLTGAT